MTCVVRTCSSGKWLTQNMSLSLISQYAPRSHHHGQTMVPIGRTGENGHLIPTQLYYHCHEMIQKYAHGFVVLCFVVVTQSFIMKSHEVFIHIHQGCFAGTGAIVRLPQCQWSKPDGYGKTSQCITTTTHSKAKTVCIFLGIYCITVVKFPSSN